MFYCTKHRYIDMLHYVHVCEVCWCASTPHFWLNVVFHTSQVHGHCPLCMCRCTFTLNFWLMFYYNVVASSHTQNGSLQSSGRRLRGLARETWWSASPPWQRALFTNQSQGRQPAVAVNKRGHQDPVRGVSIQRSAVDREYATQRSTSRGISHHRHADALHYAYIGVSS